MKTYHKIILMVSINSETHFPPDMNIRSYKTPLI